MGSLILSSIEFYGGDLGEFSAQGDRIMEWKIGGMAYVWGRQDAGDSQRDTGYSQHFAEVYALANTVTGGYSGPLQAAYHEWHVTGRILVKVPGHGIASVSIIEGTDRAECHVVPWSGELYGSKYWPGLLTKSNSE
jgi:hypothetical protein